MVAYHSDELLLAYHQRLVAATKLSNLKLKYVANQGYFIEITPKDIASFEAAIDSSNQEMDFIRRQTLKGGERYMSTYLDELQTRIFSAKEKLQERETVLLQQLVQQIAGHTESFLTLCALIARLDVATSLAAFAHLHEWCRPQLQQGYDLSIVK
ncbi:hypothetical protein KA013_00600 [Patescibacteria group bacterium]|nr:hypothetical protein [Patescibacteria group bacterium]